MDGESTVLGLDLSLTSTGIVVLSPRGEVLYNRVTGCQLRKAKIWDEQKRIAEIVEVIEEILGGEYGIKYVAMEDYAFNQRKDSKITKQAELVGAVKYMLYQYRIEPVVVGISQSRRLTFGIPVGVSNKERKEGMKIKDKVKALVKEQYDLEFSTNDETDAFVIAEAVRKAAMGGDGLTVKEIESIRKLLSRRKGEK